MSGHVFATAKDAYEFILAGNALITIESARTGNHFTYRLRQAKDRDGKPSRRWFVSGLSGPNNDSDYAYIGLLDQRFDGIAFRLTAKSRFSEDATSVRAFRFMWASVTRGSIPEGLVIRHNGHCGRCGRTLTVPESIDRGIGPECWEKMAA